MTLPVALTSTVLFLIGLFFLIGFCWSHLRSRRLAALSWRALLTELRPVERSAINTLALEHLQPQVAVQRCRTATELWDLVGGVDGLTSMKENADILIALAAYTQRWNPEKGSTVTAGMRRDGIALRRAVVRLGLGVARDVSLAEVSLSMHEAASAYYLMTQRLLALYKESQAVLYPVLEGVV